MPETDVTLSGAVQQSVLDRAFMLMLEFGRFGVRRKASLGAVTVNADKTLLGLSKRLLKSTEYDAIAAHDRETKKHINDLAVSFPVAAGSYLIPFPVLGYVRGYLEERRTQRSALVDAFIAVYPAKVEEIAEDLRDLYNARDYPDAEVVRDAFRFEYQFLDYGPPERLRHLNEDIYLAEAAKVKENLAFASVEIQQALRASLLTMTEHLAERLKSDDGKKKVFRDTAVKNIQEFLETFAVRNIANDAELAAVVDRARAVLDGVDPDTLRKEEALREAVAGQFEEINAALAGLIVVNRPARQIDFDDDVEAESASPVEHAASAI